MMERKGTASNIELKRWVTESKMFANDYPVFACVEDENRKIVKRFEIIGCTTDGEQMWLRLKEREKRKAFKVGYRKAMEYMITNRN